MAHGIRVWRVITDEELAEIRAAKARGESFHQIARRLSRKPGTIQKAFNRAPRARKRVANWNAPTNFDGRALRPPHVTGVPFGETWYQSCNSAFVTAMRREFPEKEIGV